MGCTLPSSVLTHCVEAWEDPSWRTHQHHSSPLRWPEGTRITARSTAELCGRFPSLRCGYGPGSAGAPVFNNQWEVIGLHHAYRPKADHKRFTFGGTDAAQGLNEGVRISSILRACRAAESNGVLGEDILDELFNPPEVIRDLDLPSLTPLRVVPPLMAPESVPNDTREPITDEAEAELTSRIKGELMSPTTTPSVAQTLTLPLHITVSLGSAAPAARPSEAVSAPVETESFLEKIEPDSDYANRPGYDPSFLGFDVSMPKLTSDIKPLAVKTSSGGHTLKYYHYSVIMNSRRRLAFVSRDRQLRR